MSLPIKKMSRYAIRLIISISFLLPVNLSYSAENTPIIAAFYCSSEDIPFIGELMPPILPIMQNEKVRAELDLSNAQIERLKEIEKVFFTGIKDILAEDENRGRELRLKGGRIEDHVIAIGKLSEDARKRTNEILKPHQQSRMKELLLQLKGVLPVPKKDLRQLLRLDREQERAIDEIRSGIFKRIDETTSQDSVIASAGRCKFATSSNRDVAVLLEEGEKSAYRLMSPEQKSTIEKLKGKSFSF